MPVSYNAGIVVLNKIDQFKDGTKTRVMFRYFFKQITYTSKMLQWLAFENILLLNLSTLAYCTMTSFWWDGR